MRTAAKYVTITMIILIALISFPFVEIQSSHKVIYYTGKTLFEEQSKNFFEELLGTKTTSFPYSDHFVATKTFNRTSTFLFLSYYDWITAFFW